MNNAAYYIQKLDLLPHPEGGHYKEIYRNEKNILVDGFEGERSMGTSIYFLLQAGERSALHRIKSDEIWYHHDGGALEIIEQDENQQEIIIRLGKNIANGEKLQHVVKAGRWFGAHPAKETEFVLVGCQVSPGFDYRDWEMYE